MVETNNRTKSEIDLVLVRNVAERFLKFYKKASFEVSIVFVDDKTIRRLNKTYKGRDSVTDILAFEGEGKFLGEIIIDYAQIKRQAAKFSDGIVKNELVFILVHGLLHLVGFDDETEAGRKKMIRRGKEFCKKLRNI